MSKTVLIVEDDAATRDGVAASLRAQGFTTVGVATGEEALPTACDVRPDAILLDVGLPGMDGWDTMRELQAHRDTREIPIVLLTSYDSVDDLVRGYVNGAAYYLAKPCSPDELLRGVRLAITDS